MTIYPRKYGVATSIYRPLLTRDLMDYKAIPTIAAGDCQIDKDKGGYANIGTLPAETTGSSKEVEYAFLATEMQAKTITIRMIDQTASKEWEDDFFTIETYGNANAQHGFDLNIPILTGLTTVNTDLTNIYNIANHATYGNSAIFTSLSTTNVQLLNVKGATAGKVVVSADGLTVEMYDTAGNLLATRVRTGSGPYTWTPTWA